MIGDTVSHYRITAKLGEGGMGAVYRAEDTRLHRPVALKFFSSAVTADPATRHMPLEEARTASRLNHPAIATIYEVDEADGRPFLAMELVEGETLARMLERGALAPGRLLELARQLAEGLEEAHRLGILHRDVKPGNVMVTADGRVKILDFGIAVLTGQEKKRDESVEGFVSRTATMYGTAGTVPYMSPEQLRGEALDARSDVFSFGALLYECLAGRRPFVGETSVDVLHAILRRPLTPIRTFVPEISEEWEQLVESCLAKDREQRPRSMAAVLEALRRAALPAARPEKSLAVLYFENLSRDEEDEYFRDGITEDIITELSKIEGLQVFSRTAVLGFRDKPMTAPQVGQQLGATHVLEGSLRRAGSRLRITGRLVETRSGHQVWAERYDRQLEDVFAIQDEIAQSITRALRLVLSPKEKKALEKGQPADVQAYDFYLRGRQFFHQFRRQGFDFARQMFARAIVVDPSYARAYAGVADCCSFLYMYYESSQANLKEADSASRKAVELDPDSAEAHASRGLAVSLRRDYAEAVREFETATRLNPKLFEAWYFFARARFGEGNLEEAARLFQEASRVDPDGYQAVFLLAMVQKGLGRDEEAMTSFRKALRIIEQHLELHPDDARAVYLGSGAWCELGERDRSIDWAQRALAMDPDDTSVLYNVACSFALNGRIDDALDCLEKSVTSGLGQKEWLEHDPTLAVLRDHPRFQALLARLEAPV